jgi:pyruvate formate lyase activating enzyme
VEGELYEKLPEDKVRCFACGHRCLIPEGRQGVCRIRFNESGVLRVPFGYVVGFQSDPIEKKPFFHVLPGSSAMSFGMLGCDLHCPYCQNWNTSQAIRDDAAGGSIHPCTAEELVDLAIRYGAKTVTSTYNEPLITSEWAAAIFKRAKERGLHTSYVSNGNGTPEVIDYLRPWTDFYKVDLKSFQDKNYRKLGGTLQAVLDTIRLLKEKKFWVEIVTLLVPGWNDSEEELRDIARFIASVGTETPWHITAFHEDYKMHGMGNTRLEPLLRAAEIGKEAGLQFVYVGNVAGQASRWENTYCPSCHTLLVERRGFRVGRIHIRNGACSSCGHLIAGIWE